MEKITTVLWFDMVAEEAANFYTSLLPDSEVTQVIRAPSDNPSMSEGGALVVEFTLAGRAYAGLNGGPLFKPTEAVSFQIVTEDQEETDRLWNAIVDNGGQESQCGWCKDKWGFSWQIAPRVLLDSLTDKDPGRSRRASEAMLKMQKIDIATLEAAMNAEPANA